jgi:hypothetical protein
MIHPGAPLGVISAYHAPVDLTYLIIAGAILALPALLSVMFAGSGDTKIVLGAFTPAPKQPDKRGRAVALREQVQALVMQRRPAEAVKLVQSASGVPLEKAQEIVAVLQRAKAARPGKR